MPPHLYCFFKHLPNVSMQMYSKKCNLIVSHLIIFICRVDHFSKIIYLFTHVFTIITSSPPSQPCWISRPKTSCTAYYAEHWGVHRFNLCLKTQTFFIQDYKAWSPQSFKAYCFSCIVNLYCYQDDNGIMMLSRNWKIFCYPPKIQL